MVREYKMLGFQHRIVVLMLMGTLLALAGCGSSDNSDDAKASGDQTTSAAASKSPSPTVDEAAAWAKQMKSQLLQVFGVKRFSKTCSQPGITWPCLVTEVSADSKGTLTVRLQETNIDKDAAKKVAVAIMNLLGSDNEDLQWVVIEDATGTVVAQAQRSDAPLLNM